MLAKKDRVVVIGVFGIPVQTGTIIDRMEASEDSCAAYQVRFDRSTSGDSILDWWVEDKEVILESEFTAASSLPQ
jgi:hypothetical protein